MRTTIVRALAVGIVLAVAVSRAPVSAAGTGAAAAPEELRANDNRVAAGVLRDGVLTLRLEVRPGIWHPDGEKQPGVEMLALAEPGRAPQMPGPLIRVPEGTTVRATIRNPLADRTLTVHGLHSRPLAAGSVRDTVQVAAGATRAIEFTAGAAGTYYYWASTAAGTRVLFDTTAAQLVGAFVIDPRGARPDRDRILVLGGWVDTLRASRTGSATVWFINGRSWPYTERFQQSIGDTVRLRVINASRAIHPMHLHGFYFRVDSRGDGRSDTTYASTSHRDMVFTERMPGAATTAITWVPERAGNWLLHCHIVAHFGPNAPLLGAGAAAPAPASGSAPAHVANHALEGMGGLVTGFEIAPRRRSAPAANGAGARRRLRLLVREDSGGTAGEPAFGYTLERAGPDGASGSSVPDVATPSPTIVLRRGEPVSITVVNRLAEATSVHWHGIELESYFDGVPGFGGEGTRLTPAIAPSDSFEVLFTPPRAGTFIYHTHAHERRQLVAGLAGALLVVEPDSALLDPARDVVLMVSTPRRLADAERVLVNASLSATTSDWRVGVPVRLRLINIHQGRTAIRMTLRTDTTVAEWRPLAKDAMPLAGARATVRPATQQVGVGETYDFEFTPRRAGAHRVEVRSAPGVLLASVPVWVR